MDGGRRLVHRNGVMCLMVALWWVMVSANMGICFPLKPVFPGVKWLGVA